MSVSGTEPFLVALRRISEFQATPQCGQLASSLSPQRFGFNPRPVRVEFVVQKVALLIFPCQYHSINAPHPFIHSSYYYCYQKGKWVQSVTLHIPGNIR